MTMLLPDGRTLDYREYGDPRGVPVVNNHGGLVCGLDIASAADAARRLGVRLISPDRPGVGRSSPMPGRSTADWAQDVAALLDHLGLDRAGAFGWSLGSDYALALGAAGIATRVVVVGGMPPVDAESLARLNTTDRVLTWLSQEQPALAYAAFSGMRVLAAGTHRVTAHIGGSEDRAVVAGLADFPAMLRVALQQPQGMAEEYRTMCRPWGFALADVTCPVAVWHGELDDYVPVDLGRELAAGLPDACFHEVAGAGHFLAYRRWPEVLAAFVH